MREGATLPFGDNDFVPVPLSDTWAAMEELVATRKAKAIGVSNFSAEKLMALLARAQIIPAVNQVELHPMLRQDALLSKCASLGVHVSAYSPLGSPRRPDRTRTDKDKDVVVLEHPGIVAAAVQANSTAARLVLRWGVQRGTSVLPKSTDAGRLADNLAAIRSAPLSDVTMRELSSLPMQIRMLKGAMFVGPQPGNPYKTLEDLWDEDVVM